MGNTPSSVPFDSSINLLNTTLQCTQSTSDGNTTVALPFSISVTAPLKAQWIQNYYYGDLSVAVTLPQGVVYDQREYGDYYNANITTTLEITAIGNPTKTLTLFDSELRKYDQYTVNIPANGGVLPPQGPFSPSLLDFDYPISLSLKSVLVKFNYLRSDLFALNSPLYYTCGQDSNPNTLATTIGGAASSSNPAPANGFTAKFPATSSGSMSSIANVPLACNFEHPSADQSQPQFNFTIGGTGPAKIASGSSYTLTNFNTFLTVPGSVVSTLSDPSRSDTYRLELDSGKASNGSDLNPGIGAYVGGVLTDLAREWNDDKDGKPLNTARNVQYNFQGQETFALPLVASLTRTFTQSGDTAFVQPDSFQGVLHDFSPPAGAYEYSNILCSVQGKPRILAAPIV